MIPNNPLAGPAHPKAGRPTMPGYGILPADQGSGLLPWSWALERLDKARNYWLSSTRPDGRPHAMPVWGVWLADRLCYSTGAQSRKARNLAVNPACVISIDLGDEAIIVEGVDATTIAAEFRKQFCAVYGAKYAWDMEGFAEPVHVVRPVVAFAFRSGAGDFSGSATRWVFE